MATMTQTAGKSKAGSPKPGRTMKYEADGVGDGRGLLTITQRDGLKTVNDYYGVLKLHEDDAEDGFRLQKADGTTYDVLLSEDGHRCDCIGHERYGYCKHASALVALRERGLV